MKLPPFELATPASVDDAVACLAQHGDDATVLAGGQSLVPLMALRLATPAVLVDLDGVPGLDRVEVSADGGVVVGAMTRQRTVERDPIVRERTPLLAAAIARIGHAAIRNQGTVGGSIAHADPAAELPAVALATDAEMVASGPNGSRSIPAGEFFAGYMTTTLAPDEVLVEIRFAPDPVETGVAFEEFARRHGDFAVAGIAASVSLDADGRIGRARLALAAVGSTPLRANLAEAALRGSTPDSTTFAEVAAIAASEAEPVTDLHGTAAYRRHLIGVLARRALARAARRAREPEGAT